MRKVKWLCPDMIRLGADRECVAAAKHAAFVRARGRHYSNEAEAMKVCTCLVAVTGCRLMGMSNTESSVAHG